MDEETHMGSGKLNGVLDENFLKTFTKDASTG